VHLNKDLICINEPIPYGDVEFCHNENKVYTYIVVYKLRRGTQYNIIDQHAQNLLREGVLNNTHILGIFYKCCNLIKYSRDFLKIFL